VVNLSWNAPADGGSAITGYSVLRGTSASGPLATLGSVAAGTTSYADTSASPGTAYYYEVQATNAVGAGAVSNEVSATAYTTASAPTLTALAGRGQVVLSWTTPANGGQSISGYRIYRSNTSGGEVLIQTITTGTSYVDNTTTGGTTYFYKVAAITAAGDGAKSNEASATPKK
jgi:titin